MKESIADKILDIKFSTYPLHLFLFLCFTQTQMCIVKFGTFANGIGLKLHTKGFLLNHSVTTVSAIFVSCNMVLRSHGEDPVPWCALQLLPSCTQGQAVADLSLHAIW